MQINLTDEQKEFIILKGRLHRIKIERLEFDPFSYCNARCWFCPVKYKDQPEQNRVHMPLELMEKIFVDAIEERNREDGLIHPNFNFFTTAHYNEVLLYKHFEEMLELARKYKLKTMVLSNGVPLSKQKIDLIDQYRDVVEHVGLNVPAFEKTLWAKRAGFNEDQFDRLISNIKYAEEKLNDLPSGLLLVINGVSDMNLQKSLKEDDEEVPWLVAGPDFDLTMDLNPSNGEHEKQIALAKKLFPNIKVSKNGLMDRAGAVTNVMTNEYYLNALGANKKVVGCNNWGDRITTWLHINNLGQGFLCCNDYDYDYIFGDFSKQSIREVWGSDEHVRMIQRAMGSICRKCTSAQFN